MSSITTSITLFRERSTVYRFGFGGDHNDEDAVLAVRSNRVSINLRSGPVNENVVIRGQNIPSTLRLTALVIEQFDRNPMVFSQTSVQSLDWGEMWKARISSYERQYAPESWVSLHHDGMTLFTTNPSPSIDAIERVAQGHDINDMLIRDAVGQILGSADDVVTQHDSQTAVVFTPFKDYVRAAILERRGGRTGSYAVSAHHPPKPKKPVRFAGFIGFCADLIEAQTLRFFVERIKQMVEENRISGPPVTPAQVAAAMSRRKDLMQFVVAYEQANRVTYRPERPVFF